jgi:hypothetical protein
MTIAYGMGITRPPAAPVTAVGLAYLNYQITCEFNPVTGSLSLSKQMVRFASLTAPYAGNCDFRGVILWGDFVGCC